MFNLELDIPEHWTEEQKQKFQKEIEDKIKEKLAPLIEEEKNNV